MSVLFVGCGNMGSAIVRGMLNSKQYQASDIEVILPANSPHHTMVTQDLGLLVHSQYPKGREYEVILFAVKPQTLPDVLPQYQDYLSASTLIISIAAGKKIAFFERFFPHSPIVRVMPNINLLVGRGVSGAVQNSLVVTKHTQTVEKIFAKTGYFTWLEREELIDVVVALSGSSPAYYFLFTELLARIAHEHGIAAETALHMAEETLIGSAFMKDHSRNSLSELRAMITSEKGTTHAAITRFQHNEDLYNLLKEAFVAAIRRSEELSQ